MNELELESSSKGGFTLLEFLMAVSVIGIIISIAITAYDQRGDNHYMKKMRSTEEAALKDIHAYLEDPEAPRGITTRRLVRKGQPDYNTGNYKNVLPTSRPSPSLYIYVEIKECDDPKENSFLLQTSHEKSTKKISYDLQCSGAISKAVSTKEAGSWW